MEALDDDEDFLSLVEAAEATAKKRKLAGGPSSGDREGSYTAALKGSKSLVWQQQATSAATPKPKTAPSDAVDGNSCFKCGKPGHWARDCSGVGAAGDRSANPSAGAPAAEKPCPCGAGPCLVFTANTERNRGRKFHRCPNREENGGCGFFEWCDSPSVSVNPSSSAVPDLPCPCGAGACIVLTAKTEKNMGQQFYRCPANQGESCGFFKWCSEHNAVVSPPTSGKRIYSTVNDVSGQSYGGKSGSSCFKCGEAGHWSRDCPKPSTDSYHGGGGRSDYGGGGRSDSTNACYKCGKAGHWAKDCPSQEATAMAGSRKKTSVRSSQGYRCK